MPAVSKKQQIAMAIAEHEPEKLHAENKGLLEMSHKQLHDFAATPRKDLPTYAHARDARKKKESKPSYSDIHKARKES